MRNVAYFFKRDVPRVLSYIQGYNKETHKANVVFIPLSLRTPMVSNTSFQWQQFKRIYYTIPSRELAVTRDLFASKEENKAPIRAFHSLSEMDSTYAAESKAKTILPAPSSPYEYALLSKAAYFDAVPLEGEDNAIWEKLIQKGWQRVELIHDESGYCGSIWANEANKQIVIAHRGSRNATSWVTDIESVIQKKPGTFVSQAIKLMHHPRVLDFCQQNYRLSTTGHSLGGFLAQVCVYWAQRSEFPETFYPDMSAIVFDSPGVVDFLNVLHYNLESEKERINISRLNIHNFCSMPTVVSTYGKQTGTLWHLGTFIATPVHTDFFCQHKMSEILKGFDAQTGEMVSFRAMRGWPQANYSAYENISSLVNQVATDTVKLPFNCLNALYKSIKGRLGYTLNPTWYDQIFSEGGQVWSYLNETSASNRNPDLQEFDNRLSFALDSHYVAFPSQESAIKRMGIYHFDANVGYFLKDLAEVPRPSEIATEWDGFLCEMYGKQGLALLQQYRLEKQGKKVEIILSDKYPGSVLKFQSQLHTLLRNKDIVSYKQFLSKRDEAFRHDFKEIRDKRIKVIEKLKTSYLYGLPTGVPNLIKRKNIIEKIECNFASVQDSKIIQIILAPGGMGKTQSAIKFAEESSRLRRYKAVVWIPAGEALETHYQAFAHQLIGDAASNMSQRELIEAVTNMLDTKQTESILFIFDNVKSAKQIEPYLSRLPNAKHMHVLITTQNHDLINQYPLKTPVTEFTREEAINYVRSRIRKELQDDDVTELARIVHCHPLSLSYLTAYINAQNILLRDFYKQYEQQKFSLLEKTRKEGVNVEQWKAILLNVEQTRADSQLAGQILEVSAFLGADNISRYILTQYFKDKSQEEIDLACGTLKYYSLINDNENNPGNFYTHRFLQEVIRYQINSSQKTAAIFKLKLLTFFKHELADYKEIMESDKVDKERKENIKQSFTHAQTFVQHLEKEGIDALSEEENKKLAELYSCIGNCFYWHREYSKAQIPHAKSLKIRSAIYGDAHCQLVSSLSDLGNVFYAQNNYTQAKIHYEKVLEIDKKSGAEESEVASSLNSLGNVFCAQGNYAQAQIHYEKAWDILIKAYGENNSAIAYSLSSLGNVFNNQGDYIQAKNHYEQALQIYRAVYGECNPDVALSLNNLGVVFSNQGKYFEAKTTFEQALQIYKTIYGECHPDVANAQDNLGMVLYNQRQYALAQIHFEQALRIQRATHGEHHLSVATSFSNLGNVLCAQSEYDQATNYHRQALQLYKNIHGEHHSSVATSFNNLGNTFCAQGNYAQAQICYGKAHEILIEVYGERHPAIVISLANLGNMFNDQGDYVQARNYYKKAIAIVKAGYRDNHPNVLIIPNHRKRTVEKPQNLGWTSWFYSFFSPNSTMPEENNSTENAQNKKPTNSV